MNKRVLPFMVATFVVALSVVVGKSFSAEDASPVVLREFIFDSAPFASCHASTIAEANDGTLVAAWFAGSKEGAPDVAIWSSYKENSADRWTAPKLAGDADEKDVPCWNPVLFQPKNGPLMLFYKEGRKISQWRGVLLLSRDSGRTWGERSVLPESFIGPVKNKPVELSDGTILCPSSEERDGWRVHFEWFSSSDHAWRRTAEINEKEEGGAIQPSILFHRDGKLQAICRNQDGKGKLWQTWSSDGGRSWSRLEPTALPNPCSGTDAVTLQDGRQLLVYNHTNVDSGGRNILNVAVSDDGVHWRAVLVLENSPGEFSYPSVIQTRDGMIHIVYTWKRERVAHVVLDPDKIIGVDMNDGRWPTSVM